MDGLTRENVASHLQKYRLYLKRVAGVSGSAAGMMPGLVSTSGGGGSSHQRTAAVSSPASGGSRSGAAAVAHQSTSGGSGGSGISNPTFARDALRGSGNAIGAGVGGVSGTGGDISASMPGGSASIFSNPLLAPMPHNLMGPSSMMANMGPMGGGGLMGEFRGPF